MRIPFTKMHGAGNDFIVLDETRGKFGLTAMHYRRLADRHFGVGADQILSVRSPTRAGIDFEYVIHNADGTQVEQCGNGARCFARFVRERGLSNKSTLRVQTLAGVIEPQLMADGQVTVNMGAPVFTLPALTFDTTDLKPRQQGTWIQWPLSLTENAEPKNVLLAVVSMGNPHAVQLVSDVDAAPVLTQGPLIQSHARFPEGVNVGYMQVIDRTHVRLRVFERGAGETLACGSGACAAVVAGIRLGLLDSAVHVHMRGGTLTVAWDAGDAPVRMTGPATTVFRGEIEIPDE